MTSSCEYEFMEYTNEDSIDPNLICSICHKPFRDPVSTPCDHTYGRACITHWLTQSKNASCPTCVQQPLAPKNLIQASRPLRNMLDKLRTRCILCGESGIERGNFLDHIAKYCQKATAPCQAEDIKCPWKGSRDELQDHVSKCSFEPLRPVLSVLIAENKKLSDQVLKHDGKIKNLTEQLAQLNNTNPKEIGVAAAAAAADSDNESDASSVSAFCVDSNTKKEENAIFIRNLPCSVEFNDVFRYFSNVGRIQYDTRQNKIGVFIFKAPNQKTGFCTAKVIYAEKASAAAAVAEFDKKPVPQWNTCLSVCISEQKKKPFRDATKETGNTEKINQSKPDSDADSLKKKNHRRPHGSRQGGKPTN